MNYWLGHLERDPVNLDAGLGNIWLTAKYVHDVTGSWDHVMLGTDFDGFTDPPDDLRDSSQMPRVTEMLFRKGVSEEDVKKIIGGQRAAGARSGLAVGSRGVGFGFRL